MEELAAVEGVERALAAEDLEWEGPAAVMSARAATAVALAAAAVEVRLAEDLGWGKESRRRPKAPPS